MNYRQHNAEERSALAARRSVGLSHAVIAGELGRHRSTVWRELKRNAAPYDGWYRATRANERAVARRKRSRRNSQFGCEAMGRVEELLKEEWSPGQVSGHLSRSGELAISHETIYRHVWQDLKAGGGDRSHRSAMAFVHDLSKRVPSNAQVTSDGLASYKFAVASAMPDSQFAQLVKVYEKDEQGRDFVVRADKMPVFGNPDMARVSTSFIESSNLHMRMQNRRYNRQTNAHSKKSANYCHMLALGFMPYNFAGST